MPNRKIIEPPVSATIAPQQQDGERWDEFQERVARQHYFHRASHFAALVRAIVEAINETRGDEIAPVRMSELEDRMCELYEKMDENGEII